MGAPKVQTKVVNNTVNPSWNHEANLHDYTPGDTLVFKVYHHQDFGKHDDYLGFISITSDMFDPHGFEGELPLQEAGRGITATLQLRIQPRGPHHAEKGKAKVAGAALREEVEYLSEVVRKEVENLHERIELLAGQIRQGGPQAPTEKLQQLTAALEEEVGTRCAKDDLLQKELV